MSKRQARFGVGYFTGTALPAGYACSCCGQDKRGQIWPNCVDLRNRYHLNQRYACQHACRRYLSNSEMPLCPECLAEITKECR